MNHDRPAFVRSGPAVSPRPAALPPKSSPDSRVGHIPAEGGVWILLIGDMTFFAVIFGAFLVGRAEATSTFVASASGLSVVFGAVNTIVLLTSSLFVALAVQAHRARLTGKARRLLTGAGTCAALFATLKAVEWSHHLAAGNGPTTNSFWTFYYTITGIHLFHVLIGSILLALMWRASREPSCPASERLLIEGGASYWHMVDLLWVLIFPLLYLGAR